MRLKGKLLDSENIREQYPVKCVGDNVEIELPPVKEKDLQVGQTVLRKVKILNMSASSQMVTSDNAGGWVNNDGVVAIISEPKEEIKKDCTTSECKFCSANYHCWRPSFTKEKSEIDFESMKVKAPFSMDRAYSVTGFHLHNYNKLISIVEKLHSKILSEKT